MTTTKKPKKPKTGPRVDLGEGVVIGMHALPRATKLVRDTKAAAKNGLTRDEAWALINGDFRALFDGVWDDVTEALED